MSVFDGTRWVSADVDQGLASSDLDEDGIREDPDGSIWLATTGGLSHLKDPASLFVSRPLPVSITRARPNSNATWHGPPQSCDTTPRTTGSPGC
ncbi:MAG: hypothetical protein INR65_09650 [Gluconacetobacter diazotrophicus]|nr:hypothetical protein [Gluconacetobacter diazotrophicus]